ncbi:MAG TPA: helix-turn-helix transcriptional regulator [Rhodocyclaceae bacterium]|nr:helix-turn-helix transcriptional regulator [Rhodocyclaceae bacterium]
MATSPGAPRKSPPKKRTASAAPKNGASKTVATRASAKNAAAPGLLGQMRAMAGRMLDMGASSIDAAKTLQSAAHATKVLRQGKPIDAAAEMLKAVLPGSSRPGGWAKTGAALRKVRESAGLTIQEVGAAINLNDPALIETMENGVINVPFEIVLRLAAVLGRNDPIGFVMSFTRTSNPEIWNSLEALGLGKLILQSAREREFANIYRGADDARNLSDAEFAEVLAFTRAAFEMAMTIHGRRPPPKSK